MGTVTLRKEKHIQTTSDELAPNLQHQEKPEIAKPELKPDQLRQLFEILDLSGIETWSNEEQNEV